MQVLKTEIYNRILTNAESMFYSRGFSGASMRDLAEKVGISFSNLYRYFKNKNDLYDALMQPYYAQFMDIVSRGTAHEESTISGGEHLDLVVDMFIELVKTDRQKFIILVDGSQGTRYESVQREMIRTIQERIQASLPVLSEQYPLLIKTLAANLFRAILEMTRNTTEEDGLRRNLKVLIVYHLGGIKKLMEL